MQRPSLNGGMTLAVLTLLIVPATAATISISNLVDGNPVVTTDLLGQGVSLTFEQAIVSGSFAVPAGVALAPGTRSVTLVEPASDQFGPRVSDFATLTIGEASQGLQSVRLLFQSDGAAGFDANVANLPTNTPMLTETGDFVDVTTQLGGSSDFLVVRLASDLATAEPAEPGTWVLLTTGLLVALAYRRLKRARA